MKRYGAVVLAMLAGCVNQAQNPPQSNTPPRFAAKPTPAAPKPKAADYGEVRDVQLSPDGKLLAIGTLKRGAKLNGFVLLRNANTNALLKRWEVPNGVTSLAFSPDGTRLATGQYDSLSVWQVSSGKRLHKRNFDTGGQFQITCDFSPDGKTLAVGYGELLMLSTANWKPQRTPINLDLPWFVDSVQFSPDGRYLVTTHHDVAYGICLWSTRTGRRRTLAKGDGGVVVFSNDSRLLTALNSGGTRGTEIFNTRTGQIVGRLGDDSGSPWPLAFSPDNRLLVGSNEKTEHLELWDVRTGKRRRTLPQKDSVLSWVDERTLVTYNANRAQRIKL